MSKKRVAKGDIVEITFRGQVETRRIMRVSRGSGGVEKWILKPATEEEIKEARGK